MVVEGKPPAGSLGAAGLEQQALADVAAVLTVARRSQLGSFDLARFPTAQGAEQP